MRRSDETELAAVWATAPKVADFATWADWHAAVNQWTDEHPEAFHASRRRSETVRVRKASEGRSAPDYKALAAGEFPIEVEEPEAP